MSTLFTRSVSETGLRPKRYNKLMWRLMPAASRLPDWLLRWLMRHWRLREDPADGWNYWLDASYHKYERQRRSNMGDKKYGRIFTDKEVRELVQWACEHEIEGEDELESHIAQIDSEDGFTFPVGEPLFILRAKDKAAPATISSYYQAADNIGAGDDHLDSVEQASIDFQTWQESNPGLVKIPD